jgi:hypothetical protein
MIVVTALIAKVASSVCAKATSNGAWKMRR